MTTTLTKLTTAVACETHLLCCEPQLCNELAYWRVGPIAQCDECILDCLDRLPDNRQWLADALVDIAQRKADQDERRRLFFATMRHPDLLWVRRAMKHLRDDAGYRWQSINAIEVVEQLCNAWGMITNGRYFTVCSFKAQYQDIYDFVTVDMQDFNPFLDPETEQDDDGTFVPFTCRKCGETVAEQTQYETCSAESTEDYII